MFQQSKFKAAAVFFGVAIAVVFVAGSSIAAEKKFPEKPIQIVVPMPAGGPHDVLARVIATQGKKFFGVPLIVVNAPGSGGAIGSKQVLNAAPDGYTLLVNHGGLSTNYHTGVAEFNYDGFQPICRLAAGNECLTTYAGAQWKDLKGLIEHAKKNPGRLKYAATSGGTSHFVMAAIEEAAKIKFLFVPYQGEAPRTAALAGHHVDLISATVKSAGEYAKAGKFAVLGVFKAERSKLYPDYPTLAEQGLPVNDTLEVRGMFAPKATPKERVAYLEATFKKVLEDPEFIEALYKTGQEPAYLDAQNYTKYLKDQDALIERSAKILNLKK